MKSFKFGRYLGVGLGVGIATFVFYQMQQGTPEAMESNVDEFRSLSQADVQFESPHRLAIEDLQRDTTKLVKYDLDATADNQISLPATDELTAAELYLAPELSSDVQDEMPKLESPQSVEQWKSETETISILLDESDSQPQVSQPQVSQPQVSESQPASDVHEVTVADANQQAGDGFQTKQPQMLYEMAGSSWKKNPFIDGGKTAFEKNETVDSLPTTEAAEFIGNEYTASEPVANDQTSELDDLAIGNNQFQFAQSEFAQSEFAQSEFAQSEFAPQDTQTQPKNITLNPVSKPATVLSNEPPEHSQAQVPGDQYSIAPLQMGLSESVAQRAAHHIEYGKALSRRGAAFAARQEFYSALRVLAQANDARTGARVYSEALRNGIQALKEAEEFMVKDTETQIGLNVELVIETHRTGVLTEAEATHFTPVQAMQRYFAYAEQQLEMAGGRNVVAAEALYCMGKLHSVTAQHNPTPGGLDVAKAIVFHRAALASDQTNFRSANELGVLLARTGQLEESKKLLKRSLLTNPTPQVWENLAKVHTRSAMGRGVDSSKERNLAQLARDESQRMMANQSLPSGGQIQWMPGTEFNANAPMEYHEAIAAKPVTATAQPAVIGENVSADKADKNKPSDKVAPKSFGEKLKDLF